MWKKEHPSWALSGAARRPPCTHQVMECRTAENPDHVRAHHVFPCQDLEEGGFASSIGAYEEASGSWWELEREVADNWVMTGIAILQCVY